MATAEAERPSGLLEAITAPFRKSRRSSASTRQYEKPALNGHAEGGNSEKEHSIEAANTQAGSDPEKQAQAEDEHAEALSRAREDGIDRRRYMRVVPAWVDEDELRPSTSAGSGGHAADGMAGEPLQKPATAQSAVHNHTPAPRQGRPAGRRFDYARDGHALLAIPVEEEETAQLMAFMHESVPAQQRQPRGQVVSREWMEANVPDLAEPWQPAWLKDDGSKDRRFWLFSPEKRLHVWRRSISILMRNPFVPLVARLAVLVLVLAALGLGVNIYRESSELNNSKTERAGVLTTAGGEADAVCKQQTSTYMAFIVDSFAVLYIVYITWDEYFSKPLGLRKTKDKIRLLFLDLLFVIFSAANLSLAFNTLTDQQWSCYAGDPSQDNTNNAEAARSTCVYSLKLCRRQRGLCAVLLLAEIAWVLAFAISIFRVVERIQR